MEKRRGEVLFSRLQSGGPTLASNPAPSTLFQSAVSPSIRWPASVVLRSLIRGARVYPAARPGLDANIEASRIQTGNN